MKYKLLLDDVRNPPKDKATGVVESGWRIARTVDQAINIVFSCGMPEHIAFDHDLGEDAPGGDGMQFAKWICEYCMDNDLMLTCTYHVHSMNPEGAKNIKSYLQNFKKMQKKSLQKKTKGKSNVRSNG